MESSETSLKIREDLCNIFPTFTDWLSKDSIFGLEDDNGLLVFDEGNLFLELAYFLANGADLWQTPSFKSLSSFLEGLLARPVDDLLGAVELGFLSTVLQCKALAEALRPHLQPRSRHIFELGSWLNIANYLGAT